ncbi:MAG TPA: ABC transporter permease [Steroidobacteraceae bacterium]|jgi:putative ABC transport system permease protein|nr:ABC transporter permease [Steroidobacteraceae bacterium]
MKYLPLVWAGIWRKKSRAVLMLLQIVSAFLLFGLLQGLNSGIKQAIAKTHSDRLYVASNVSLGDPLPISLLADVKAVRGVDEVSPFVQFPGIYQRPGQAIPITAVDVRAFFRMFPDYVASKAQLEALENRRTGAIIGANAARRYGINVGDRLTLQSPMMRKDGGSWVFDVVGTYDVPSQGIAANNVIVHYDYVNEARLVDRDTVILFVAHAANPANAAAVGLAIDNKFANSSHETRTQSEGDLVASQIQRIADLDFIVGGIIGAVFFALLLATGTLMMQSIRERTPELGVLKTLGYSDRLVMTLILVEAVTFCIMAAVIGLVLASFLLRMASPQIGLAGMPNVVIAAGLAFAIALALLGGSVPAWRGLKLQVADALADR